MIRPHHSPLRRPAAAHGRQSALLWPVPVADAIRWATGRADLADLIRAATPAGRALVLGCLPDRWAWRSGRRQVRAWWRRGVRLAVTVTENHALLRRYVAAGAWPTYCERPGRWRVVVGPEALARLAGILGDSGRHRRPGKAN